MIKNRKAHFNYEVLETYTAGICLQGNEIKSIRANGASIDDSYCIFDNNELFLVGSNISAYKYGSKFEETDPTRNRKLLLKRNELNALSRGVKIKGLTIIPLSMFFSSSNKLKVEIALCRGKHSYDKRNDIRERDIKRENSLLKF